MQLFDKPLTKAGHLLGFDQLMLKEHNRPLVHAKDYHQESIQTEENSSLILLKGTNFRYVFNKMQASFDSLTIDNCNIIEKPLEYNIWRAPTDNDSTIRNEWESAGYNRALVRVYETTLTNKNNVVKISCRFAINAIQIQHILDLNVTWTIGSNGTITLDLDGKRNTALPFLPRLGLRLFLPKEYNAVEYLGSGPNESYIDKHRSSWFGRFKSNVENMYVDYIKPQENSSHFHCEEVILSSSTGKNIHVNAAAPFSFQTSRYTQEELASKAHNYELLQSEHTVLCLDYKMSGIGSNSCGPALANQYQLREEHLSFQMTLQF